MRLDKALIGSKGLACFLEVDELELEVGDSLKVVICRDNSEVSLKGGCGNQGIHVSNY